MVRVRCRRGHSLPELIVAVTFLGASLGAVGTTAAAAAARTRTAVLQQEAVREAAAILDSLLAAPVVQDGNRELPGIALRWITVGSGATPRVEVTAIGPNGRDWVRLEAPWFPPEEALPRGEVPLP